MTLQEAQAAFERATALLQDYLNAPAAAKLPQLRQAIGLYEAVLRVYTERDFPVDWAMTQNNLANAYASLPTGDRGANLQQAIACYQAALRVYTERDFPVDWAMTQNNLAFAYRNLPMGDRRANLQQAIACYQAALRVYTERDFPVDWAMTQHNLATAYRNLPTGDQGANLQQAIKYYEAALRVYTAESLPFDCLPTLHNLGNLYFGDNAWPQALETYIQAVMVTEQVREMAVSEAERRRVLQESSAIFERAVLSALRTRQHHSLALTLTERGKTRNLADQVWRREVQPRGASVEDWQQYQGHLSTARELERRMADGAFLQAGAERERGAAPGGRDVLDRLRSLHETITALESRFRDTDPDYVPFARPLALEDITTLAKAADAVVVEFRVTAEGTYVFLVGPADTEVTAAQVVEIPELTTSTLGQLLVRRENDTLIDGWLVHYYRYREKELSLADWLSYVDHITRTLYEQVLTRVHKRLQDRYPQAKRLILVPNQGLNLLPLHACWWESKTGERHYLLDDYEIAYTPSCQVLKRCLVREQADGAPARSLFAVQNPDSTLPLPFSDWEVEEVCKFFPDSQRRVLAGAQATAQAVKTGMLFGEEKLFSCHGRFDLTNVEQSCLELSDGVLTVADILRLDLRGTWLAVKSACETGLTDFRDIIDEYQGLPAAFLVAGATTVVPSLWAVNDFSTALLMQRFHANLYEHQMAKASALREAQCWLRDLSVEEVEKMLEAKRQELAGVSLAKRSHFSGWRRFFRKQEDGGGAALAQQRMSAMDAVAAQFQLRDLAALSHGKPFANPYWWGAFQCVGAGWKPVQS